MRRFIFLPVLLLLALPVSGDEITLVKRAHKKNPAPATRAYAVKRGDMLNQILLTECGAKIEKLPYLYNQFRKLNPGIKNLNLIVPGQKLVLPGRQTPASVPKNEDIAVKAVERDVYVIKQGEHLTKVLREVYGLSDDQIFREYLEAIKGLNPKIKNINYITPGQKILIPVKSQDKAPDTPNTAAQANLASASEAIQAAISSPQKDASLSTPSNRQALQPQPIPEPLKQKKENISRLIRNILFPAVKEMGGTPKDQGTYFMPLSGGGNIAIDTQEIPVMELDSGNRIILDLQHKIPPKMRATIEKAFPNCKVITESGPDLESLMDKVLNVSGYFSLNKNASPLLVGNEEKLKLSGKWIVYKDFSRRNVLIINILEENEPKTPQPIQHYAQRFGLELIELGGVAPAWKNSRQDPVTNLKHSLPALFDKLDIAYEEGKVIDLGGKDTGIQISYKAPLFVGQTIFASQAPNELIRDLLTEKGLRLQNLQELNCRKVLRELGYAVDGPPLKTVISKGRAELEIPAFQTGNAIILEAPIDPDIAAYLKSSGKDVLLW